ncbi:MAG: gamma-glutamyltransferase [Proteobacteria bacterium]|nr:gamma-glutamyltransferase [Pseudomonadota bacterium]
MSTRPSPLTHPAARAAVATLLLAIAGLASAAPAAVAAPDRYGAAAAEEILKAGGNAIDAAIATGFALAVSYPEAGNLGGGGFSTIVFDGKPYFLDYRERAPATASADMYLDARGEVVPGASTIGSRAAAVPGTVRGLWELHRRFGSLPWSRLVAPSIRFAREGFVVSEQLERRVHESVAGFAGRTNFARYFAGVHAGQKLAQPELAATLERIAAEGVKGFYGGRTAELVVAQMQRDHGLITAADLAAYHANWRAPLETRWAGYGVITAPPPSSGGIALVALLKMREDAAPLFKGVPHNSAQYVHLVAEIEKRVFADRAEYLGDPDFVAVPVAALTDEAYLARRAREINPEVPSATRGVQPGLGAHHNTTHYSIVDHAGNAVSTTYTINDDFGNGVVVEGAGFLLNNEMDDFSVKPGVPNIFGVVGGAANAIGPHKTPLSSMTPTILTRDGKVALVIGTPGGSRIFTWVFQVIANWHDFGMPLKEAVAAVRVHHQLLPENLIIEEPFGQLDAATKRALEARGYRFENPGWGGDIAAIAIGPKGPEPVADPRGIGVGRVIR